MGHAAQTAAGHATVIENQQLHEFRTTGFSRTRGWSSPAAPVGPWKDIWLERRSKLNIKDVSLQGIVARGVYFEIPCFKSDTEYFNLARNGEVVVTLHGRSCPALTETIQAINSERDACVELIAVALGNRVGSGPI